jgi:predicted RNA-binding Zn ribbon-like protein
VTRDVEYAAARPHAPWLRCETGATWLDLLATVGKAYGPAPVERLADLPRLREWLAAEHLLPEVSPTDDDLARARELREALRGLALAAVRSKPSPEANITVVNTVLAGDRPLRLHRGATPGLGARPPATAGEAFARIARQAAEQLTGPLAATLRSCSDPECGMLFLDPGGRRRWCAAEVCGVRNRVRAHRHRRKVQA